MNGVHLQNHVEEEYMTDTHLKFFKEKLLRWRDELYGTTNSIKNNLKEVDMRTPDPLTMVRSMPKKNCILLGEVISDK